MGAYDMRCVAAAVKGDDVEPSSLLAAFHGFCDDDDMSTYAKPSMLRAQLEAMLYFAEAGKDGSAFVEFLDARKLFDEKTREIGFESLLHGFEEWRWHSRQPTPERM